MLLLLTGICLNVSGQDFCSLIKKEVSPDRTIYDFASPYDPAAEPVVRVTRSYGTNPDYATDNFFVIFRITGALESIYKMTDTGEIEIPEHKLVVEFDDQSKYEDDKIQISHDFTEDRMNSVRYIFYPLNDTTSKEFASKKIVKFSLAGFEQAVPPDSANAIEHYVQCMRDVKKD